MITNAVSKESLRRVQGETLTTLKDILANSFGPYGSNTVIYTDGGLPRYTKDGHTILKSVGVEGPIEKSVVADIEEETRTQAIKVGDSTTSVTILSSLIFDGMTKIEGDLKIPPADIVKAFQKVTEEIKEIIRSNGKESTIDDMYKIALISTNGNEYLAGLINTIYQKYGLDVFIDVLAGVGTETNIKELDGMVLESGYGDQTLVNTPSKNVCSVRNPKIYCFQDPIDTAEMGAFLDCILHKNIIAPMFIDKKPQEIVETVIICPHFSRDYSAYMGTITGYCQQARSQGVSSALPLNIITNVEGTDMEQYNDIRDLCGAKWIKKYIDPEVQKADIKAGIAPTMETIDSFAGSAELVESDNAKTKFVNPKMMRDKNGEYTDKFKTLIEYLELEIDKLNKEGNNTTTVYALKKRLNSLKSNMVEVYVGGITVADRDQMRDLMEDAVLNCRSAAANGIGRGANYEGFIASYEETMKCENDSVEKAVSQCIFDAYDAIIKLLYSTIDNDKDKVSMLMADTIDNNIPYNIRTKKFDGDVLSSIETDICALDSISKIITLMVTANQFLCPTLNVNRY
jgi:chaperonin GroEL (HSP60 family)